LLKKTSALCATLMAAAPIGTLGIAAAPTNPPAVEQPSAALKPITVAIRRITESQYRHTIADVFGSDIKINARFEPEKRDEGLLAIGTPQLSLTSSGFEQYFVLASSISEQALGESKRDAIVGCKPADRVGADETCARHFISSYGERLFRRPLTDMEISGRLRVASQGATQSGDFYAGLKLALTSLLVAPEFLFRVETAEADPANPRQYRLDAYSKASRVAFLLWDTAPDEELLAVAGTGAIHTESGLKEQLARMISSPRYEQGARAFFRDMLQLDGIENVVKDPAIYPKFSQSIADGAMEQTLKTTIELLITQKHDYRDLFTSNEMLINRPLASVYNVPFLSTSDWVSYTFPQSSERTGILTQVSFLALFSHPGSSSPTKRGIKVNEIFKCEPTPNPPADVDFSKVKDSSNGTIRGRLLDHMENTGCTVCHRRSDPPGLALEHFDGLGQLRTTENGVPIDVSADLGGVKLVGAQGLARYLHDDPKVPACLVRNVYAYGVGRKTGIRDEDYLADQTKLFANNGYRVPDLMVQVASSPEFFKVAMPAGTRTAALSTANSPGQLQQAAKNQQGVEP
jgi:Protein of unknown function (DUF1592)/Protein of unknown function (DUF1588)/Protein of unknown function (DUF1595)/Protein of unknown function (DUF1585)/Protein of unknown function (DUF1587)